MRRGIEEWRTEGNSGRRHGKAHRWRECSETIIWLRSRVRGPSGRGGLALLAMSIVTGHLSRVILLNLQSLFWSGICPDYADSWDVRHDENFCFVSNLVLRTTGRENNRFGEAADSSEPLRRERNFRASIVVVR